MRATNQNESIISQDRLAVTTERLQNILDCGRPTAVQIGTLGQKRRSLTVVCGWSIRNISLIRCQRRCRYWRIYIICSEPTDAKGTVDDRTVTGIEEQLNKEGETADSVTKTATEGTKEFYTISTKSGKIFYLIIDNSKSQDNVYFLTEVSEKDLMNFTLSDSVTLPEVDTVYAEPEKQAEEEKPETTETAEKDKVEDEIQMPEDKSPFGTYLLIALVAVGAAAGGYYFKVYKPKHEYDDEDEMEEDEDESEDSESEKREVDDADEQEESIEPEILRDEDFDDAVLEDEEEEQE